MKKIRRKNHIFLKIIIALFLIPVFTSIILVADFYIYYRSIDAELDTDTLFYSHGLTTKIYVENEVGAAVELKGFTVLKTEFLPTLTQFRNTFQKRLSP